MIHRLRHGCRLLLNLVLFGTRSGRWWAPVVMVCLVVASILVLTIKTVVPVSVYTLL